MREESLERRKCIPNNRFGAEQIVTKLRQIEVLQSQGKSVAAACKLVGLPRLSAL
jgi:hypothetical protein